MRVPPDYCDGFGVEEHRGWLIVDHGPFTTQTPAPSER